MGVPDRIRFDYDFIGRVEECRRGDVKVEFKRGELEHYRRRRIGRRTTNEIKGVVHRMDEKSRSGFGWFSFFISFSLFPYSFLFFSAQYLISFPLCISPSRVRFDGAMSMSIPKSELIARCVRNVIKVTQSNEIVGGEGENQTNNNNSKKKIK
jgi:hypothetical protein